MTSVSINLSPSNLGANFSEAAVGFSLPLLETALSLDLSDLEMDTEAEDDNGGEAMAVAEAAAADAAAKIPDFFMLCLDLRFENNGNLAKRVEKRKRV